MDGERAVGDGAERMSRELYLAIHAAEFPAQALLRLRPELHAQPVAVLDGPALQQTVCSLNRHALQRGVVHGITRLEAEGIAGLQPMARSTAEEESAHAVLLECAAQFSPRIEETSRGTACAFVLDVGGSERLFGPADTLAAQLGRAAAGVGFRVAIAVSENFYAARMKAASTPGIHIIASGEEARALEKLTLALLDLSIDQSETFAKWGIRTLCQLAALPEVELVSRFGPAASRWRALAAGVAAHNFQPIEPALELREFCEFESPVEEIDSLLFVAARMIEALVARASSRSLAVASLAIEMRLEGGQTHRLTLHPAIPSADRKFLLKLLHLEAATHPPQAAVLSLAIEAVSGHTSKVQLGLFAPQTPEPSHLDVTLARIRAIVGEDRVGTPALEDTHRPHSFQMQALRAAEQDRSYAQPAARIALRRVRPPRPIQVTMRGEKPAAFRDGDECFSIASAYGPWRSSGCWWSLDAWDAEEWDVEAADRDGVARGCLLVRDRLRNVWQLEAFLD
jgi:protein ImuB